MSGNIHTMGELASVFFYLIVYMISAYFMSKSKILEDKKLDMSFVVAALLPVLLAANRYYVGTDFENYYLMYKRMSRCSFMSWVSREISLDGIPFGIWFVSRIAFQFNSYEVFYGLLAGVIFVPVALMIKKEYSKNISFLAILMFLTSSFTSGLNITKQVAAVSMLIAGMRYVFERKIWKFTLFVFFAYCFHPTAVIAFPIYFLWKSENSSFSFKRMIFILSSIIFINYLPQILTLLGGKFESYTIYTDEISNKSFYLLVAWVAFFLLMRRKYIEIDRRNDLYITMMIIGLVLNISGFSSPYVKRIAMYYTFPQNFLIFQIPFLFAENEKYFYKILIFLYIVVMFVLNFYVYEFGDILPYKFGGGA